MGKKINDIIMYAKALPYIWLEIRGIPYVMDFSNGTAKGVTAKWMLLFGDDIDWRHIEIKAI
jgi:hypothetical protein